MLISVISDTHDNVELLLKAINISNDKNCTHLFHLGDIVSPFTAEVLNEFKGTVQAVFGNNDGDVLNLRRVFNCFGGSVDKAPFKYSENNFNFLLMHEPWLLEETLKSGEYDYILFGHMHKRETIEKGRTIAHNPGETGGWTSAPCFSLLDPHLRKIEEINL